MKPISLQLYSVRAEAEKDFKGVLKAVVDIGYKGVELAGLHGHDPSEIADFIKGLGMQVSSSHTSIPTDENVQELVDLHKIFGCDRLIGGFPPEQMSTLDKCLKAVDIFNKAADLIKPYGMKFGFHNHWWEFNEFDGKYAYDIILEKTSDCFSELDVYWTAFSGANPAEIVSKYKSRIPFLHIKDGMLQKDNMTHKAVGSGAMDIPPIINAADPDVLEWVVVELDACETDMMEAVKQSYEYLTSNKLAVGNK